eukprot:6510041-Pyramimonas_sp.AAC.1
MRRRARLQQQGASALDARPENVANRRRHGARRHGAARVRKPGTSPRQTSSERHLRGHLHIQAIMRLGKSV